MESATRALRRHYNDFGSTSIYRVHALVLDFVKLCAVCQRNKTEQLLPVGLLQPLDLPSSIWADVAMDFVKGFPRVHDKSVVLTVVY
jgi:hypothetical protein